MAYLATPEDTYTEMQCPACKGASLFDSFRVLITLAAKPVRLIRTAFYNSYHCLDCGVRWWV